MATQKNQKTNPYEEITNQIIAALEKGVAPWTQEWIGCGFPSNFATGKRYNGVNVLLLWIEAMNAKYEHGLWLTYKQAQSLGGQVRKGEKGTRIMYWNFIKKDEAQENGEIEEKKIPVLRTFTVFNVAQVDGLDVKAKLTLLQESETEMSAFEKAQAMVDGVEGFRMMNGMMHQPAYFLKGDHVTMPTVEQFETRDAYYGTLFHEMAHWTGAESRLNRRLGKRFGDAAYAFEELVAELSSAFLCAEFGFAGTLRHPEYIGHWVKKLGEDHRAIFTAARLATEAVQFLLAGGKVAKAADEEDESVAA